MTFFKTTWDADRHKPQPCLLGVSEGGVYAIIVSSFGGYCLLGSDRRGRGGKYNERVLVIKKKMD